MMSELYQAWRGLSRSYKYFWLSLGLILILAFMFQHLRIRGEVFPAVYSPVVWSSQHEILSARVAEDGQWRLPPSEYQSPKFEKALLEYEDRGFYEHPGVELNALVRALYLNLTQMQVVSGASTLTMQIARMSARAHGQTHPRSYVNKIKEMVQSIQLEWKYSKEELLHLYMNHAPFGGNVVGIVAASWKYFGSPPSELSWSQAATLAVLPNNPSIIHLASQRPALKQKRNRLLMRLHLEGELSSQELDLALQEELPEAPQPFDDVAPHAMYCKSCPDATLDQALQVKVQGMTNRYIQRLSQEEIDNAAVLVLDLKTQEPIVYVANQTSQVELGSHVDMIQAFRSPGSTLKPFLFHSALKRGLILPGSLLPDYPSRFGSYRPQNYSKSFYGAIPAWRALSESLNIPAVYLLQQVGVEVFQDDLRKWGFHHMQQADRYYGLTLALGGAESSLWELVHAYGHLAQSQTPASQMVLEALQKVQKPQDAKVWEHLGLENSMAWKTGTSWGFRDAWAIGVTPDYAIGVWVGNAHGEGRPQLTGVKKAAPLLFEVEKALSKRSPWAPLDDQVHTLEVCQHSGYQASPSCPRVRRDALAESSDLKLCPYHKEIRVNPQGERVHSQCGDFAQSEPQVIFEMPPKMAYYFKQTHPHLSHTIPWSQQCPVKSADFEINFPDEGSQLILPKLSQGHSSEFILEASHQQMDAQLFWFLNGRYLGETREIHQQTLSLSPGRYELTIQNQSGDSRKRKFQVLGE